MRRGREKLLSLMLALVMVMGLLPSTAWAAGEDSAVMVTMSVVNQGVFAADRTGKAMIQRTVTVTDRNKDGRYSLDEALAAAHEAYAPNGEGDFAGEVGQWGYTVTKLWGVETSAVGFYKNNAITGTVDAEVLDHGDAVTAFIYRDQTNWTDRYAYFTKDHMTVCVGAEFESKLQYDAWGTVSPQPTAPIGVLDGQGNFSVPDSLRGEHIYGDIYAKTVATGSDGTAKMSFTQAGTYALTAQYDSTNYTNYDKTPPQYYLVPPVCTVTVMSEADFAIYQQAREVLDLAKDALTWSSIKGGNALSYAVTGDLTIPSELEVMGQKVPVSWSCDDSSGAISVSNYYGAWGAYVDRPAAQDVSCTLTATLTYGGETAVKAFPITIKAEGVNADKESVVTYGKLLTGIASGYPASTDAWVVLDMAAYSGSKVKGENYGNSSVSAAALADTAIQNAVLADTLNGVDISGQYAIYTIPYLSLAYQSAEIANDQRLSAMKTAMVDALKGIGSSTGVDDVVPVLAALAPYYQAHDAQVVSVVDSAVDWLSNQQNSDGTFSYYKTSNANSTALTVVALSALGIDAHADSRFIINGKSAMEGLFSFALGDHSGFGYKGNITRNTLATEQGFRALVAYARFRQNNSAYNIYLQAKDSRSAVTAPNITATVKPPEGGGSLASYQITIRVMVPPKGGADGQYTYRYHSGEYTNLLGSDKRVTASAKTTALEMLASALDAAGISYTAKNGYISEIGGLSEQDHGPNSGWQYMVDGTTPSESADSYTFSGNAKVVWYYTDDYTKEKSASSWQSGIVNKEVMVKENQGGTYSVILPEDSSGPVLVTIPDVGAGQVVVIVRKDGTQEVVRKSRLQDGTAYLLLKENAIVKVIDYVSDFDDVKSTTWYASAVDFAVSRGLFSGVGEGIFGPELPLNRGMLVTVLYALEQPGKQSAKKLFADVDTNVWYAQGTAWGVETGIISGYGNGLFGPDDHVTREQLALMLYKYANSLGMNIGGRDSLTGFRDGGDVSNWAEGAMAWAVNAGILGGRTDGTLDPGGNATRAEAAAMLRQFVALMLK